MLKKTAVSLVLLLIFQFVIFPPVVFGKDKKGKGPFENPDAVLTIILFMERGKKCKIEPSSELMELYYTNGKEKMVAYPTPIVIDFKFNCGDCTASGKVTVTLLKARLINRDNKKYIHIKIDVDNDAIMVCHPLNPLNNQKYQSHPFEATYEFPFEDGYRTNFSPNTNWMHFSLEVTRK